MLEYHLANHTLQGFDGASTITNAELLELECDILVPAVIDKVITGKNAPRINARVVLEAANHPFTPEADDIMADRGIPVLPDILVNAGGVIVSYFEWTQNLQEFRWEEDHVNKELGKILSRAYKEVRCRVVKEGITYREAAFEIGVERVAKAASLRGFV